MTQSTALNEPAPPRTPGVLQHALVAIGSARGAVITHYASLIIAGVLLRTLTLEQWFFFDEWAFMWEPERELWAGHGGHWSTIAIGAWMALQSVFQLDSYRPFILVAVIAHLVVVHLLWRLMRKVGAAPWVATALAALFAILGAASENLLWAFQFAFMGAIACGLAATVVALSPRLTLAHQISIGALMIVGEATSGTLLPFFVPVALIVLRLHGWRKLAITVVAPALVYLVWFFLIAGPNPNRDLRATEVELLFTPQFAGSMFVDSVGKIIPLPYIGAVVIAVLGMGAILILRRRASVGEFAALSVLGAGVVFALLTSYSRWGTGLVSASSGRYVYVVFVAVAPLVALLVTRAVSRSAAATWVAVCTIAVVGVYNLGILVSASAEETARENFVQQAMSAGFDMQDRYPGEVDDSFSPEPRYLPVLDLAALRELSDNEGLAPIGYARPAWLTALVNVGLTMTPTDSTGSCETLTPGREIASGSIVSVDGESRLTIAAYDPDGTRGNERTVTLLDETNVIETIEDTPLIVVDVTGAARVCDSNAGTADE